MISQPFFQEGSTTNDTDAPATPSALPWFYKTSEGRKGPFASDQIAALIQADVVGAHTMMWSEAVSEWTPLYRTELRGLLGDTPILPPDDGQPGTAEPERAEPEGGPVDIAAILRSSPSAEPQDASFPQTATPHREAAPSAPPRPLYRNQGLGKWVGWIFQGVGYLSLGLALYIGLGGAPGSGNLNTDLAAQFARAQLIRSDNMGWLLFLAIISLLPFVLFVMWKYRVTANVVRLAGPQTITPAGAVYWYFVPVLFFWKPYQAMSNIWRAYAIPDRHMLGWWWGLWLGVFGVGFLLGATTPETVRTMSEAQYVVFGEIAVWLADAGGCFAAAALVKRATAAEVRIFGR